MKPKKNTLFIEDENGEFVEVEVKALVKELLENYIKEDVTLDDSVYPKEEAAKGIVEFVQEGNDLPEELDMLSEAYEFVKDAFTKSEEHVTSLKDAEKEEAERKKAEREAAKKEKEEQEKNRELAQSKFLKALKKGSDKAAKGFKAELEKLGAGLPEGVQIVANDRSGFGLKIGEEVTEAQLGNVTGYFLQRERNSAFMQNTFGFLVGALCNTMVERGVYVSKIKASEAIAEQSKEGGGPGIGSKVIQAYARMDERIPLECRNSEIADRAYLELANAKKAKKAEGESKDDFKAREKAYEADRLKIAEKLKEGELQDSKQVRDEINKIQIKHGLKEAPDPEKKSTGDYLRIYFFGSEYLANLTGVHEEDAVVFQPKDSADELAYSVADLKEMVEEARLNLTNALVNYTKNGVEVTLSDLKKGEKKMEVPKLDLKGKPTGDTATKSVPVYPLPFFHVPEPEPKEEETAESGEEE